MKLVSLDLKKKIRRFLPSIARDTACLLALMTAMGGIFGMFGYLHIGRSGEAGEKAALQEKVGHLLESDKNLAFMQMLTQAARKGSKLAPAINFSKAQEEEQRVNTAFDAEAQETAIALAHARKLSPDDRYVLYRQLQGLHIPSAYFPRVENNEDFLTFGHAQSKVMDRPGFRPTLETAREITSSTAKGGNLLWAWFLLPPLVVLTSSFTSAAVRKRLAKSIDTEQAALWQAQDRAREAEAARLEAETAERERLAAQPVAVATALESDISVRQIKLAARGRSR